MKNFQARNDIIDAKDDGEISRKEYRRLRKELKNDYARNLAQYSRSDINKAFRKSRMIASATAVGGALALLGGQRLSNSSPNPYIFDGRQRVGALLKIVGSMAMVGGSAVNGMIRSNQYKEQRTRRQGIKLIKKERFDTIKKNKKEAKASKKL